MHARRDEQYQLWLIGCLALLALVSFVMQATFFTTDFRPDEWRSLPQFLDRLAGSSGLVPEIWTRVVLLSLNLALVGALWSTRLITGRTLALALIWPLTLFLFSKIYWEFFVFPLCLIRLDLKRRQELVFIGILAGLLWLTGEANLIVIMVWRCVLLAQKSRRVWSVPIVVIVLGIALDQAMQAGVGGQIPVIGESLARFTWTRDIVNPEYSVLETLGVFFVSFHFFSLHDGAYWIDAAFSATVLAWLASSREFWGLARQNAHLVLGLVAVVFLFTSVTHAFQNARYYFFFMPVLSALVPPSRLPGLALLGLLHVAVHGLVL